MLNNKPSPLRRRIAAKTWLKIGLACAALVALIGYFAWDILAHGPLMQLLTNHDQLVTMVESWGVFAPLSYIFLQVVQIVVAPIPGNLVGGIGGFIFGTWGILWTLIGTALGCFIVFILARVFGRPLIEKLFKKSAIQRFDFIFTSRSAGLVIFLIFLLPGLPDDLVCYLAGLTKLSIKRLLAIAVIARFPTIVVTNYLGAGLTTNLGLVIVLSVITALLLALAVWQRARIMRFLHKFDLDPSNDDLPPLPDSKSKGNV